MLQKIDERPRSLGFKAGGRGGKGGHEMRKKLMLTPKQFSVPLPSLGDQHTCFNWLYFRRKGFFCQHSVGSHPYYALIDAHHCRHC